MTSVKNGNRSRFRSCARGSRRRAWFVRKETLTILSSTRIPYDSLFDEDPHRIYFGPHSIGTIRKEDTSARRQIRDHRSHERRYRGAAPSRSASDIRSMRALHRSVQHVQRLEAEAQNEHDDAKDAQYSPAGGQGTLVKDRRMIDFYQENEE